MPRSTPTTEESKDHAQEVAKKKKAELTARRKAAARRALSKKQKEVIAMNEYLALREFAKQHGVIG